MGASRGEDLLVLSAVAHSLRETLETALSSTALSAPTGVRAEATACIATGL
ncbi:MAG: hypothetical protein P4L46_08790 [Fimbriimonas sp.]|nr:hypothetical protein [Fimbriimonas sp.]